MACSDCNYCKEIYPNVWKICKVTTRNDDGFIDSRPIVVPETLKEKIIRGFIDLIMGDRG
jgi:hypothetical protein